MGPGRQIDRGTDQQGGHVVLFANCVASIERDLNVDFSAVI